MQTVRFTGATRLEIRSIKELRYLKSLQEKMSSIQAGKEN